jgi:hypothetical protein
MFHGRVTGYVNVLFDRTLDASTPLATSSAESCGRKRSANDVLGSILRIFQECRAAAVEATMGIAR